MSPIVTFDFPTFLALYPEFQNVGSARAQAFFDMATLYHRNDGCGFVQNEAQQLMLLNMLTAHLLWLNSPRDADGNIAASGSPPAPIIGRISSASEGSVSLGAEWQGGGGSPSAAFFLQTRYGAAYWQAVAQYRTARYVARPTRVAGTAFPFIPGFPWVR